MNRTTAVLVCILTATTNYMAIAWDNPGHMAVAGLAYDELSEQQQNKLVALLNHHPAISLISEGFPGGNPAARDFVMAAATWPDLAKRSKDFRNNGYEEHEPAVTNVKFDRLMHKGWHFIDQPLWVGDGPAPTLPPIPKVNAVGVVKVLVSQLQSSESEEAKAYDLGWLLHLVGDLHQPLHAVTGVSETYPNGDTGGNGVTLAGLTRGESELHAFWDDALGKTAHADKHTHLPRLDRDAATASQIISEIRNTPLGRNPDSVDPETWASESYKMAERDTYAIQLRLISGDRGETLQATLDTSYGQTATWDAKQRIRLAGHRLAVLLQQILQ